MTMNAKMLRATIEKFSGRSDIFPDDVDDPELLLRALVRKVFGELRATDKSKRLAEMNATGYKRKCDQVQEEYDEMMKTIDRLTKELKVAHNANGYYSAKIAFLGDKWEKLTGDVNKELKGAEHDAVNAVKWKGEMRAAKTEVFASHIVVKGLKNEIEVFKKNAEDVQAELQTLYGELVAARYKDLDWDAKMTKMEWELDVAKKAYAEEKADKLKQVERAEYAESKWKKFEGESRTIAREKEIGSRALALEQFKVSRANREARNAEDAAEASAHGNKKLEESCQALQEVIKERDTTIAALKDRKADADRKIELLEGHLEAANKKLKYLQAEREDHVTTLRGQTREIIVNERRASEGEREAKEAKTTLVNTSSRLVAVQTDLEEQMQKIVELEKVIVELRADLKEYQGLAAERGHRAEKYEKETARLTQALLESEGRENRLEREIARLKVAVKTEEGRTKESDTSVAKVTTSLDSTQKALVAESKEVKRLDQEVKILQKELNEWKADSKEFRLRHEKAEEELKSEIKKVKVVEDEVFHLKHQLTKTQKSVVVEEDNAKALSKNVRTLGTEITTAVERYKAAEFREIGLQKQIDKLKDEIEVVEKERDIAKERLKKITGDCNVLSGTVSTWRTKCHDEQMRFKDKAEAVVELVSDVDLLKVRYDEMSKERNEFAAKLTKKEKEVAKLEKELKKVKVEFTKKEKEVVVVEESVQNLTEKLDDYAVQAHESHLKSVNLAGDLKDRQKQVSTLEVEVVFNKDSVERVCDAMAVLQAEMSGEQKVIETLKGELVELQEKLKFQTEEADKHKDISFRAVRDLETSQMRLRESEAQTKKVNEQFRSTKKRLEDTEVREKDLRFNSEHLLQLVQELQAQLAAGQGQRDDAEADERKRKKKLAKSKSKLGSSASLSPMSP
eukprot:TRINITY_DN39775_c0_g1_i1.p1 TRINITY_DN39775_c0_g1~~TRINITY_DN39775_c0_g1_i1.p1  ORF type:complete len:910 (-),score=260.37 TRINITY_DN39775_c0_g1_i1:64-2793(-)